MTWIWLCKWRVRFSFKNYSSVYTEESGYILQSLRNLWNALDLCRKYILSRVTTDLVWPREPRHVWPCRKVQLIKRSIAPSLWGFWASYVVDMHVVEIPAYNYLNVYPVSILDLQLFKKKQLILLCFYLHDMFIYVGLCMFEYRCPQITEKNGELWSWSFKWLGAAQCGCSEPNLDPLLWRAIDTAHSECLSLLLFL